MGLVDDLAAVGYDVDSPWDFLNQDRRWDAAVPVLLRWLPLTEAPRDKEGIVRALSVPWARPEAVEPLIHEYKAIPVPGTQREQSLRWAVGNALGVLWDDTCFDELVALVRDQRYGKAREMLALGLRRSKRPEASEVLVDLLDDPDVDGHAADSLARRRLVPPRSRTALERLGEDHRPWVRKAARKGLAKLS